MAYALPADVYSVLLDVIGDRSKVDKVAAAIERSIEQVTERADEAREVVRHQVYEGLRQELATKEFVRAENAEIRADFEQLRADFEQLRANFEQLRAEFEQLRGEVHQIKQLLKILIALVVVGLTVLNPAFVDVIRALVH